MALADVAQDILNHAATGPSDVPGQKVRNTLSPHLERLIIEAIRGHIIKETQKVEKALHAELEQLRAFPPELSAGQFDLTLARLLAILRNIYK